MAATEVTGTDQAGWYRKGGVVALGISDQFPDPHQKYIGLGESMDKLPGLQPARIREHPVQPLIIPIGREFPWPEAAIQVASGICCISCSRQNQFHVRMKSYTLLLGLSGLCSSLL